MKRALGWTIHRLEGLVVVSGDGVLDLSFLTAFRMAMRAENAVGYGKLFDLRNASIQLFEDVDVVCPRPLSAATHGRIAIVIGRDPSPLLVDTAVLLKSRIGNRRRLRIFTDEAEARRWLSSEAELAALPARIARFVPRDAIVRGLGR